MFAIVERGSERRQRHARLDGQLQNDYPLGPFVTQLEQVIYTYGPRRHDVPAPQRPGGRENVPPSSCQYVDEDGTVSATPGGHRALGDARLRGRAGGDLPGNPSAISQVITEANMRNLAFRFSLS